MREISTIATCWTLFFDKLIRWSLLSALLLLQIWYVQKETLRQFQLTKAQQLSSLVHILTATALATSQRKYQLTLICHAKWVTAKILLSNYFIWNVSAFSNSRNVIDYFHSISILIGKKSISLLWPDSHSIRKLFITSTHTLLTFAHSLTIINVAVNFHSQLFFQVKQLGNKSVSWVRVRDDHILTVDR